MDENKLKKIEDKLFQLFTRAESNPNQNPHDGTKPTVIKVIRRRKGKPDLKVA